MAYVSSTITMQILKQIRSCRTYNEPNNVRFLGNLAIKYEKSGRVSLK